jgi:hypothetical protein
MKNKILSTIVISLLLIANAFAQEPKPVKIQEFGLTFANLDNFGIRYKTGNEKTLLRITVLAMNIGLTNNWGEESDSTSYKYFGYGAGFRIGFEKPINIVKNFNLFYGLDLTGGFNYQRYKNEGQYYNNSNDTIWSISSGIAFVFGGTYSLGDHFRFSAEISPSLQYRFGVQKRNGYENFDLKMHEFDFGFSNYGASITVAYRFNK